MCVKCFSTDIPRVFICAHDCRRENVSSVSRYVMRYHDDIVAKTQLLCVSWDLLFIFHFMLTWIELLWFKNTLKQLLHLNFLWRLFKALLFFMYITGCQCTGAIFPHLLHILNDPHVWAATHVVYYRARENISWALFWRKIITDKAELANSVPNDAISRSICNHCYEFCNP